MIGRTVIVYHKSEDGKFLIEVKRYKTFGWARRWAKAHPNARVYAHSFWGSSNSPRGWWEFDVWCGRPNAMWILLTEKEVDRLPERLDSV